MELDLKQITMFSWKHIWWCFTGLTAFLQECALYVTQCSVTIKLQVALYWERPPFPLTAFISPKTPHPASGASKPASGERLLLHPVLIFIFCMVALQYGWGRLCTQERKIGLPSDYPENTTTEMDLNATIIFLMNYFIWCTTVLNAFSWKPVIYVATFWTW